MKTILTLALIFAAGLAQAQSAEIENVISDQTTNVNIDLNRRTVKCSVKGYTLANLKVLVPALAEITVMNHRNDGEGAPCIAAGACLSFDQQQPALSPDDILKHGNGVDTVPVRVVLSRVLLPDEAANVCRVSLKENVFAIIRGIPFYHERVQEMPDRKLSDCR